MSKKSIADYGPGFDEDQALREMPQALAEGLPALKRDARPAYSGDVYAHRAGPQKWAWPQPGEMEIREKGGQKYDTIYHFKIAAARLENVWLDTLTQTAAVPFRNSPTLKGWPGSIGEEFENSVDDQGRTLYEYWSSMFHQKLVDGIGFTLIDLPAPDEFDTPDGDGAYWTALSANQVLEVITRVEGRKLRPIEARILWAPALRQEPRDNPDDWPVTLKGEAVRTYRVSELVPPAEAADPNQAGEIGGPVHFRESMQVEDGNGEKKWIWAGPWKPLEAKGGQVFTEVPLVPHYANRVGPFRGRPPFLDSASVQMSLWRRGLDYDERVRRDARNVLAIAAEGSESHYDGNVYWIPSGATAALLETSGAALEALRDDQEVLRDLVRHSNLRPLLAKPQVSQTATEIVTGTISANSQIEMWLLLDIASFTRALEMTATLNGESAENGVVDMPHDVGLSPEAIAAIWEGYVKNGGKVPPGLVWRELKRHGWIGERESVEAIVSEVINARPLPPED
jgi:hypothetical protein